MGRSVKSSHFSLRLGGNEDGPVNNGIQLNLQDQKPSL